MLLLARRGPDPIHVDACIAGLDTDPDLADADMLVLTDFDRHDDRTRLAAAVGLGAVLRNLEWPQSGSRSSCRACAPTPAPDGARSPALTHHQVADDALRLVGHRLEGSAVHREYAPLRPVPGQPAELGQVVTNLLRRRSCWR